MAEPIGLTSGILTLAVFAFQASITLHNLISSYRSHPASVRDLQGELEALHGVLRSLTDLVETNTKLDLDILDLPLLQCGKACKTFEDELSKCTSRSGSNRTSFRDWAKLRYMDENIDGFRRLLAGYKATINIALASANLRTSSATAERLEEYQELIEMTTGDLEMRLESINEKLESIVVRNLTDPEAAELQRIKEERSSTQQCLEICAQLSEHIDEIQRKSTQRGQNSINPGLIPEKLISDGMQECKITLNETTAKLERHMQDIVDRLMAKSNMSMNPDELASLGRLREEWTTARQCMDICSKAEQHLKENISMIDNHATGDETIQFLVSTSQKTIHGKNRAYGDRNRQIGGHLNDDSVQQLSRDISSITSQRTRKDTVLSEGNVAPKADTAVEKEPYWQNYGPGTKLASQADSVHSTYL